MNRRPRTLLSFQLLEDRSTPANLVMTSAVIVDPSNTLQPNPVYGQNTFVRASWNSQSFTGTEAAAYVRYTANYPANYFYAGSPAKSFQADSGTLSQGTGNGNWYWYRGGLYSGTQAFTITVTVDPDNVIAETNEADNSTTITVTPVAPTTLPMKFLQPIGGTPNKDWSINNYADIDPSAGQADYRLGQFQYDGHDAIDAGPWGFDTQDRGLPITAAADGVVSEVDGGSYFDRETSMGSRPWNAVTVDHGGGWKTVYGHLGANTITVKVGDAVKAGQVLGLMGSAGSSTGTHVHYTATYRGAQVEAGFSPTSYWVSPLPYGGDAAAFSYAAGVANYSTFTGDLEEASTTVGTFPSAGNSSGLLYFWGEFYSLKAGDALQWKYYRPDGSLHSTSNTSVSGNTRSTYWWFSRTLANFQSAPGTWQVGYEVNGVELNRTSFTVAAAGSASIRVADAANKILLDNRTTPIDFGSVAQSGTGPTQTFTVQNQGYSALSLSNYRLPPGFSFVGTPPASVAAAGSATVTVRLDSAVVGAKFGVLQFDTNDPDTPNYDLTLTGSVTGTAPAGAPVIGVAAVPATAYNTGSLPRRLSPTATLTDANSSNFAGGTLTVAFAAFGDSTDRLGITQNGQIGVTGSTVTFGGVSIGTFTGGTGTTPLVVNLNGSGTVAATQALIQSLTYASTTTTTQRKAVRYTLTDGTGNTSNLAVQYVVNTGVARNPTISLPGSLSVLAQSPLSQAGSFTDLYGSAWTGTVDYGTGAGPQPLTLNSNKTFTLSTTYATAGSYTITVTVTNELGGTQTVAVPVTVTGTSQTITFNPLSPVTYGTTPLTLTATASSGLPVSYAVVSGPASVSGNTLTITGAGTVVVQASQPGNSQYLAATPVSQSLVVNKAALTATGAALSRVYGTANPPLTYSVSGLVNGDTAAAVLSGTPATAATSASPVGSYPITQGGLTANPNYALTFVNGSLAVTVASQTITFNLLSAVTYGVAPVLPGATASSGLPVSYAVVSGPGTVSGGRLTVTGAGTVVVRASQPGDGNHTPAADVDQTLVVNQAPLTVTAGSVSRPVNTANPPLTFTASGLVNGDTLAAVVTGTPATTATPTSPLGTYPISQGTVAANANYAITFVNGTLTVTNAAQTITFDGVPTQTYGAAPVTLLATSSSGRAVGFSVVSGPGVVSGNTLTITGAGTIVVRASRADDGEFAAAAVDQTVTVNKAPLTATGAALSRVYGAANPVLTFTTVGLVNGDTPAAVLTGTPATTATPTSGVGSYPVSQGTVAANGNYALTFVDGTLTVTPAAQSVTFAPSTRATYGTAPLTLTASASSGLPVNFSVVSGPASVSGNTLTITGAGTVVVRAGQPGDANHTPAADEDRTLIVNPAALTLAAASVSRPYGEANPPLTFTAAGLVNGDTLEAVLTGEPATAATSTSNVGSYPITKGTLAANDNYALTFVNGSLGVTVVGQAVAFALPPAVTFAPDLTLPLTATGGGSVNPVTFTVVSGPATVSGSLLKITGAGTVVVEAAQAADANHTAAAVRQTLVVDRLAPTITFDLPAGPVTWSTGSITLSAASDSGVRPTLSVVSGVGQLTGNRLTLLGLGEVVVRATVTGTADYLPATVDRTIVVAQDGQAIDFPSLATVTYTPGRTVALAATSSSGLPVQYAVLSGPATVAGSTLTVTGPGVVQLRADQPGNGFIAPAVAVGQTLTVVPSPTGVRGGSPFAVGTGDTPTVRVYNPDGSLRTSSTPFPGFTGGVRTAVADFNGDGVGDLVAGTGPGAASQVVILDGRTQATLFAVNPFEESFTGGVYLTVGDLDGDGVPDLAVTPDEGGGPRVDVYTGAGFRKTTSFFGIDDPAFRGGARSAVADMNGDGAADLIVVAGFGGGPRVAGFDGTSLAATPTKLFADFFLFEQTLRNGVFITAGDLNGDGVADLIAGGGPGGGPRVLALDGRQLLDDRYLTLANFFGGDVNNRDGVRLVAKDLDGDALADLVVGGGVGSSPRVAAYYGKSVGPDGTPPTAFEFDTIDESVAAVYVG